MRKVTPSGLVVAAVGFLLTRSTVTFALTDDVWGFVFAGLVPLVLGLGLAALDVALAVGSFEPWYVRTSALWCCLGFLSMFVLVVLTVVGTRSVSVLTAVRADPALSNVLIGGTLTGMYAARTRRERRASRNRANRLVVLNRILHEEVINAVTVIRSRAELLADDAGDDTAAATAAIVDYADRITETIENVEYLTWTPDSDRERFGTVDVATAVEAAVETTRERHPDAEYEIAVDGKPVVHANERLTHALYQLLENAVTHTPTPTCRR